MESSTYFGHFESTDVLMTRYTAEIRGLGLEFLNIVKDAVSVDPKSVAARFGLTSAKQAYMLTNMQADQLEDLSQNGGLPYEITFNSGMIESITKPVDRTQEFNEAVVSASTGERFGSRLVSWKLREIMWRARQWSVCRELLRADLDLGKAVFELDDAVDGIVGLTHGELLGLTLASDGQFAIPQSVPNQLATVFSDARSLQQIVLTYKLAAGSTKAGKGCAG